MIKQLTLPVKGTIVTLRFDLGTAFIYDDLAAKHPITGNLSGFNEALLCTYAAYVRQQELAKVTSHEFSQQDIREACLELHAIEVKAFSTAFQAILITEPIAGLQEPEGAEKNAE